MSEPLVNPDRTRAEWIAVSVVTAIGLGLRLWPVGRLGLNQFDEGIYALVSSWSMQPKGLAAIDPVLISYAPPGYPILGGLACWLLGRSDGAMIAVSQLAGTLTIPVVAWLGRRTFGPGAGFAAATFCAFSGPHVAYSRMALTDVSFLLAWLVALGMGMRFLERPGLGRAVLMGLAVGLAQQFKYNGWLSGGIVIGSALVGALVRPEERKAGTILRTFGWGGIAAGVAWLVVWPWYAFVESHGGYSALLRHQQSYLGGFADWKPHLQVQIEQALALSGGPRWLLSTLAIAILAPLVAPGPASTWPGQSRSLGLRALTSLALALAAWCFLEAGIILGVLILPWLLGLPGGRYTEVFGRATSAARVVGVWWLALMIVTPFYHPYARLWLPCHAAHWLLMGWLVAVGLPSIAAGFRRWSRSSAEPRHVVVVQGSCWVALLLGLSIGVAWFSKPRSGQARPEPGLLAPSDALYRATVQVAALLPDSVQGLRVLVRPPVSYYLAGRVGLYPMAGSDSLRGAGHPRIWALVDSAVLRSEAGPVPPGGTGRQLLDRFADDWEVVEEFSTDPSLPTLLDLDPGLARSGPGDRSYPLWLLRPRTAKAPR